MQDMSRVTKRYEVTYMDPDTKLIRREVLNTDSDEFKVAVSYVSDPDFPNITGKFVDSDTPVGLVGRAKRLRIRKGKTVYTNEQINYEIKDGSVRFIGFKSFIVLGFTINKRETDDGDLLEVDLKKSKFAPVDPRETKDIAYLLRSVQRFNADLLEESDTDDDDFDSDDSDSSDDDKEEKPNDNFKSSKGNLTPASSADSVKKPVDNGGVKTYRPTSVNKSNTVKAQNFLDAEERKKNSAAFRK